MADFTRVILPMTVQDNTTVVAEAHASIQRMPFSSLFARNEKPKSIGIVKP